MGARKPRTKDTATGAGAPVVPAAPLAVVPGAAPVDPTLNRDPVRMSDPKAKASVAKKLTPAEEIAFLEQRIANDQARLHQLQNPVIEYPKWCTSKEGDRRVFASKADHEAAGPLWAEDEA